MSSGCSCGSNCSCGNNCSMDPDFSEQTRTETLIMGVAPPKTHFEGSEMSYGAEEGGCKCGDNCQCNPCNCK